MPIGCCAERPTDVIFVEVRYSTATQEPPQLPVRSGWVAQRNKGGAVGPNRSTSRCGGHSRSCPPWPLRLTHSRSALVFLEPLRTQHLHNVLAPAGPANHYPARANIGNNFTSPSDITSTASAAKISPIRRVITLMPVLPSTRAIGCAAAKHRTVASATIRP